MTDLDAGSESGMTAYGQVCRHA